eukprot:TRINITY_DN3014_c0_g1_i1.p1 TRINITY_DN3014_c0_g1~~TRINITY_DN3014_c0_g1_i1.p1  ORF type:complete len:312 (+),score=72.71 TRINITY_DN3014_c0_g1_i1:60-995(+)
MELVNQIESESECLMEIAPQQKSMRRSILLVAASVLGVGLLFWQGSSGALRGSARSIVGLSAMDMAQAMQNSLDSDPVIKNYMGKVQHLSQQMIQDNSSDVVIRLSNIQDLESAWIGWASAVNAAVSASSTTLGSLPAADQSTALAWFAKTQSATENLIITQLQNMVGMLSQMNKSLPESLPTASFAAGSYVGALNASVSNLNDYTTVKPIWTDIQNTNMQLVMPKVALTTSQIVTLLGQLRSEYYNWLSARSAVMVQVLAAIRTPPLPLSEVEKQRLMRTLINLSSKSQTGVLQALQEGVQLEAKLETAA